MKYLFGPVNSRRLGLSLGIDLVPHKTCNLNCVYCECGRSTKLTSKILEYVPTDEVIIELKEYLNTKPQIDMLTFSGSGEPTLHSGIGDIINFIKNDFPEYKISILTNAVLFSVPRVREAVLKADFIFPSLDTADEDTFKKIARPEKGVTVKKIINGLIELRKEYKGKLILEIFIIPEVNDNKKQIEDIKEACSFILPDLIQINSLDRPGASKWVKPATEEKLIYVKDLLSPLKVEIIGKPENRKYLNKNIEDTIDKILATIKRRPSTLEDIEAVSSLDKSELKDIISKMLEDDLIDRIDLNGRVFYRLKNG